MGVMDKFMNLLGVGDELEDETVAEKTETVDDWSEKNRGRGGVRGGKVVPISAAGPDDEPMVLMEPICFEDCQTIAEHLKAKNIVVINLEAVDLGIARRIIDFVGGTIYALDGAMQKAGGSVFVAVPDHVNLINKLKNISQPKDVVSWINSINYDDDDDDDERDK
ncbi:MAG: cell division protein SepF [Peptococcaceae bacterium]|jgi:cell division inhibitor SepF|nr:cell division protein SepF [Peptococcaceae bacterium]